MPSLTLIIERDQVPQGHASAGYYDMILLKAVRIIF